MTLTAAVADPRTSLPAGLSVTVLDAEGTRHPVALDAAGAASGLADADAARDGAEHDGAVSLWHGVVEPVAGAPVAVTVSAVAAAAAPALPPGGALAAPAGLRLRVTAEALTAPVELNLLVDASVASADPWWLIPGAFYGENRPADCDRLFPRFEIGAFDPEQLVSDHWSFRSDRAAAPLTCVWGDDDGVALAVDEVSGLGETGLGLAHADGVATVHIVAPYREDPVTYYGEATPRPPLRETFRLEPGAPAELEVTVHSLGTDRHAYAPILRERWESTAADREPAAWVGLEEAASLTATGLLDWHYDPEPGVLLETVGFDRGISVDGKTVDRQAMHIGWVSGIPWAFALLAHGQRAGNEQAVEAASRVIDFCTAELAPSGTFWGTWYRGKGWTQSWTSIKRGLHARTLGEAAHFLVRSIVAEQAQGREQAQWLAALRSNLAVMGGRQREDGNLGAIHHAETGEILQWRGAAGLAWIPAFVEAAEGGLASDDAEAARWLEVAARAGEHYAQYVDREYIHGAPEDVDLAPTSEDGYAAIMAYMALYRVATAAGDTAAAERWLDLARRSADWTLTFRYDYDVAFHPHTLLGAYRFRTRGGDQASTSNQHLASYGLICTTELIDLSEALGDPYYAQRALESVDCFRQFIARRDGDFDAYKGMVTERFYQTECFQPKGMLLTLSHAWCVGVTLLGCEQAIAAGASDGDAPEEAAR